MAQFLQQVDDLALREVGQFTFLYFESSQIFQRIFALPVAQPNVLVKDRAKVTLSVSKSFKLPSIASSCA
jgi:hypothetical protein